MGEDTATEERDWAQLLVAGRAERGEKDGTNWLLVSALVTI
jgi:hypothetical protein